MKDVWKEIGKKCKRCLSLGSREITGDFTLFSILSGFPDFFSVNVYYFCNKKEIINILK